jgi:hypothetical protein
MIILKPEDRLEPLNPDEINELAARLRISTGKARKQFAAALFDDMDDDERKRWFNLFAGHAYPAMRWHKIEEWMEQRYEKNYHWTPRKMASTYLNYSKMDSRMMPLLINRARKIKNKLRMRRKREREKNLS